MNITVQTGMTKAESGMKLLSLAFTSSQEEEVIVVLQINASPEEARTLEKEYLTIIQNALLETEGDPAVRLDGTLKELNGLLRGMSLSRAIEEVHGIVAIVEKSGLLHVSHTGRAEAYVIRGGVASQITEYSRGKPSASFVHIASGELHGRDVVVCGTQRLLRALTPAQLAQLTQRGDQFLDELIAVLNSEKERAAVGVVHASGAGGDPEPEQAAPSRRAELPSRRKGRERQGSALLSRISSSSAGIATGALSAVRGWFGSQRWMSKAQGRLAGFLGDLKHPTRKRRAHLLLLAAAVAVFLVVWAVVNLTTTSQRRQTKAELTTLMERIDTDIQTAETRHLAGDVDSANAILQRAEQSAKQVMDNESGLYRMEALDLFERIRSKREEINNIIRISSPNVVVTLTAKNPDIVAQGLLSLGDGEFLIHDKQDLYRVVLNSVDDPDRLSESELIRDSTGFDRFQTQLFQMEDNGILEMISGQPTSMKTEDPAGWIAGVDIDTYLRFLYMLSPQNNQIYKYERLSNRYGPPAQYNVNGDLSGAVDMTIDGNVYVLKDTGEVVNLFRGETRPFVIRYAPDGVLKGTRKMVKIPDGNFYFLDPEQARVVVVTGGGQTGESSYVRQYILEGDQVGSLQDMYIDTEETRLYLLDEKRLYVVDLVKK